MPENLLWGITNIGGPVILLLLFIWVIARNRKSRVSRDVTEQATRDNYAAEDRAAKKNGDI